MSDKTTKKQRIEALESAIDGLLARVDSLEYLQMQRPVTEVEEPVRRTVLTPAEKEKREKISKRMKEIWADKRAKSASNRK